DSRYGEIGISAVAAAPPYQSEVKNPAYAPAVHQPDKWTAGMAAWSLRAGVVSRKRFPAGSSLSAVRSGFAPAACLRHCSLVLARPGLIGPSLAQRGRWRRTALAGEA